jgi:peptidoglycan/LPS O-acetylase OafA/YrhL
LKIHSDYKEHVDGLRAIAVISVIFFHLDIKLFKGGFIGVDVFFVISGYLISRIIFQKIEINKFSIKEFYINRARRILPMLLFMMLFFFPFSYFLVPYKAIDFAESVISGIFFFSNFLFYWESGYFGEALKFKPFIHIWSLSVEEQFYLLFPILALILARKFKLLLFFIFFIFILSLITSEFFSNQFPNANFFLGLTRAWEIIVGIFFLIIEKNKIIKSNFVKSNLSISAFIILIFSFYYFERDHNLPNTKLLLPLLCTGILIIYGKENLIVKKILTNYVMMLLGLMSFSLYLWHQPILAFIHNYDLFKIDFFFIITFLSLIIVVSYMSWKFIEIPFRDKKIIKNIIFFKFVSITIALLITSSFFVIYAKGFLYKYPDNDKYLVLMNPSDNGRYVRKNFEKQLDKKFTQYQKNNILIIGDSQAQDFLNMALENNYFSGYNVRTFNFREECYLLFLPDDIKAKYLDKLKKCNNKIDGNIIKYAESVFMVNSWPEWILEEMPFIISNKAFDEKKIYIVGPKNFGSINVSKYLGMSNYEKFKKNNIDSTTFVKDAKVKNLVPSERYISLTDIYCDNDFKCNIFNKNGKLLSYDGSHLTKDGAIYLGQLLFDQKKLKKFTNYNSKNY